MADRDLRGTDGDRPLEPTADQRAVVKGEAACLSVDAGAGTGKTTTMLMRLERAIDRGNVDPEDVLVLTFANEAAGSIRNAVADRLEPDAAAAVDVYTYHSFCHRLVREYAYALGYSPDFEVVTDEKRRRIVGRLLAETDYDFAVARDGDDLRREADEFVATMSRENVSPAALREGLPDVRTLELCTEFVTWLERRADAELSFDNEAFRYFNRDEHLEAARESLVSYGTLVEFCREKIAEAPAAFREDAVVRDVDQYLQQLQTCVTRTIETLSLDTPTTKHLPRALFGDEIWGASTNRIEQTPIGRLRQYLEFLRLARHYTEVYADYHAALEADRALDFDELVRTATALVADVDGEREPFTDVPSGGLGDGVPDEIASQWHQVYCDEFQDTDETQFELITALTDGPDRPDLVAIGDKDQAIYGWRGTDREGLDRLAATSDDHESIALERNFRSRQPILDLTNYCTYGGQTTKTLRADDRADDAVSAADDGGDGSSEKTDDANGETPSDRVVTVQSDALETSTATQVATTVSRLLNGEAENVPRRSLADIAVITRTNGQAQQVADELRDRRIPFEVSGSPRGDISPGIQTLLSYLRVLVDPSADVHLRRVLTYRYRLAETDLQTLHHQDGSLSQAVASIDDDALEAPNRLERAREDLKTLREIRDVYPLSAFLRRFRERTRIAWFLTSEERRTLERLDRFVDAYGDDAVATTLSESVVDALERTLAGSDGDRTQGTHSSDCIDVMTVHQAKGLEFDTVLVPYLSDEEWCVDGEYARRARYRLLAATLDPEIESPLCADLATETVGEEWRVLHVALTRAENHLFVFGSTYDYDGEADELAASTASSCLPPAIEWSVTGRRMDLWSTLGDSLERVRADHPERVADRTDEIGRSADRTPGEITYYAGYDDRPVEPLETREAIQRVHRLGRLLRRGALLPAADAAAVTGRTESDSTDSIEGRSQVPSARSLSALTADTVRFPLESLPSSTELPVAMAHSYTAIETHETCPRKHYLEHVVAAIDDPPADPDSDGTHSSRATGSRLVGTIFHDVAEEAFYKGYETKSAWTDAARRQLTARDLTDHREAVLACIDGYFAARAPEIDPPVSEWAQLAAELPFALEDISGVDGEVVGYVDAVCRLPAGSGGVGPDGSDSTPIVVLDYKTTAERIDPADAAQLALYVRACEDRLDEAVAAAGYVYVGDAERPRVDLFEPATLPTWDAVRNTLVAADELNYRETTPGDHCQYCPHRSLGCAPEEYTPSAADDYSNNCNDLHTDRRSVWRSDAQ
ncbi:PD-(D/E)XK nuclease family protein [Salinadaptatus halalkaliphilus]|uniref:DNA 3'-5' helicase n=1 Tax=Salinadaptatus halalkaliphilus TaxID=2419781 RepID=A0A4S3THT3_9EURY|nr:UvrD-helicase domain-containing protein [Salinadaptatus halalkaliphilus]THE62783.1 PD-(D/E)XK nuclease family protein [Salinadaptatus halalkaliphilus]